MNYRKIWNVCCLQHNNVALYSPECKIVAVFQGVDQGKVFRESISVLVPLCSGVHGLAQNDKCKRLPKLREHLESGRICEIVSQLFVVLQELSRSTGLFERGVLYIFKHSQFGVAFHSLHVKSSTANGSFQPLLDLQNTSSWRWSVPAWHVYATSECSTQSA